MYDEEMNALDKIFIIYYIKETGLGINEDDNLEEIDIGAAIDIINRNGGKIEQSITINDIEYSIIYDDNQEWGIPGIAIPTILYDYLVKTEWLKWEEWEDDN